MSDSFDPQPQVSELKVRFDSLDGYELAGCFLGAKVSRHVNHVAVINCGAGIRASRYRAFARYLAGCGIPTLTYDYRGIGDSAPSGGLRGFAVSLEDWAEFDSGGAIRWLRQQYPESMLISFSHSIGTLLFGGAPNAHELACCVLICPHTGYVGDYQLKYRIPMFFTWHVVMPLLTWIVGYFPARALRLGADIPADIAGQWGQRLGARISNNPRTERLLRRCSELSLPALVVSVEDDAFATPAGIGRLLKYFPRLRVQPLVIRPKDFNLPKIGHFGLFRRATGTLAWPTMLAHLMQADLGFVLGYTNPSEPCTMDHDIAPDCR